jgi:hypothetical protein
MIESSSFPVKKALDVGCGDDRDLKCLQELILRSLVLIQIIEILNINGMFQSFRWNKVRSIPICNSLETDRMEEFIVKYYSS